MGYRYVIREYCGAQAILLFSYPISPKRILTAKTLLLMMFTSIAAIGTTLCRGHKRNGTVDGHNSRIGRKEYGAVLAARLQLRYIGK